MYHWWLSGKELKELRKLSLASLAKELKTNASLVFIKLLSLTPYIMKMKRWFSRVLS